MTGTELRALREKHQITQATLAERLGVSQQTLAMLELGKREMTVDMAEKIKAVLPPN